MQEIEKIKLNCNPKHRIELSIQNGNGSFFVQFIPHGMVSTYRGVFNVIVKLSPADREPKHGFLLNTHFDTVPISPGAGDANIMVSVLLESLQTLSQSNETFEHSIVILLNGSEENLLQGSHTFITSHEWAKNIRAFINLDSAGTGGKEVLFQAGPKHPWLMNVGWFCG